MKRISTIHLGPALLIRSLIVMLVLVVAVVGAIGVSGMMDTTTNVAHAKASTIQWDIVDLPRDSLTCGISAVASAGPESIEPNPAAGRRRYHPPRFDHRNLVLPRRALNALGTTGILYGGSCHADLELAVCRRLAVESANRAAPRAATSVRPPMVAASSARHWAVHSEAAWPQTT